MNLLALDQNNNIIITPEALMIMEFSAIWENDKSVKKEGARRDLAYIYFSCDYNSVYQSYPPEQRGKQLKRDLKINKLSGRTIEGVKKYKELQKTPTLRFLEGSIAALEATTKYFNRVDYSKKDDKGALLYKITDVTRCLKDAGGVIESLEKIKEKVKKELQSEARIRGGGSVGSFEDPPKILRSA